MGPKLISEMPKNPLKAVEPILANPEKHREMRGYSSSQILNLRKRLPKMWGWVDWALSKKNKNEAIRKDVVMCLMNKVLPNKVEAELTETKRFILQYPEGYKKPSDCKGLEDLSSRVH